MMSMVRLSLLVSGLFFSPHAFAHTHEEATREETCGQPKTICGLTTDDEASFRDFIERRNVSWDKFRQLNGLSGSVSIDEVPRRNHFYVVSDTGPVIFYPVAECDPDFQGAGKIACDLLLKDFPLGEIYDRSSGFNGLPEFKSWNKVPISAERDYLLEAGRAVVTTRP